MPVYPVNLKLSDRQCAVIGGGAVAERKVLALVAAEAAVTVISPELVPKLAGLAEEGVIAWIARPYQEGDLAGFFIVICAANDAAVNRLAAEEAQRNGALVNVADAPELGNFQVPSQVARGDLLLTVSTGGKSPALARRLRQELSERYGAEYGTYLTLLANARDKIKKQLDTSKQREAFWRETLDREVLALLAAGKLEEAEEKINYAISGTRVKS